MHVRPATRDDFPFWRQARNAIYSKLSDSFQAAEMERILCDPMLACFIAESEAHRPVAMLELSLRNIVDCCLTSPVGYIEGIYLEAGERGRGLGGELVEFAAQWFRQQGCREMATDAELENEASQKFFARVGFEETDRIVEFRKSL